MGKTYKFIKIIRNSPTSTTLTRESSLLVISNKTSSKERRCIFMTQMGLEYAKYKETARHNVQDEGIRTVGNAISNRQADAALQNAETNRYVSSFEPQKVGATMEQARAATSQADTAAGKLALDSAYRERETRVKEKGAEAQTTQAVASIQQADTASKKAEAEYISRLMDDVSVQQAAEMAYQQLTGDKNAVNTFSSGFAKFFEQYAASLAKAGSR